jgi:hypothetical protein
LRQHLEAANRQETRVARTSAHEPDLADSHRFFLTAPGEGLLATGPRQPGMVERRLQESVGNCLKILQKRAGAGAPRN